MISTIPNNLLKTLASVIALGLIVAALLCTRSETSRVALAQAPSAGTGAAADSTATDSIKITALDLKIEYEDVIEYPLVTTSKNAQYYLALPASETVITPDLRALYDEIKSNYQQYKEYRTAYKGSIKDCIDGSNVPAPESDLEFMKYIKSAGAFNTDKLQPDYTIRLFNVCMAAQKKNPGYCDTPLITPEDLSLKVQKDDVLAKAGFCPSNYFMWRAMTVITGYDTPPPSKEIMAFCRKYSADPFGSSEDDCAQTLSMLGNFRKDNNPAGCDQLPINKFKPYCQSLATGKADYCNSLNDAAAAAECVLLNDTANSLLSANPGALDAGMKKYFDSLSKCMPECKVNPISWGAAYTTQMTLSDYLSDSCYYFFYTNVKNTYCSYFQTDYLEENIRALETRLENLLIQYEKELSKAKIIATPPEPLPDEESGGDQEESGEIKD